MTNIAKQAGYDNEELYFQKEELRKIKELRQKRESVKKEQERLAHWMRCPKCAAEMDEISIGELLVDKCPECSGIYLDKSAVEIFMNHRQGSKLLELSQL